MVSRVVINDLVNQVINDSLHSGGATAPGSVQKTLCGREPVPLFKPADPVVNGLPTDLHMFRHLFDGFTIIQQHQSQSTPILPEIIGNLQKALTFVPLPGTQRD